MSDSNVQAEPQTSPRSGSSALHSEGRILSVLSQFAVMQVVLAATGLVRNKIVAYRLGPEAFGEIVQINAVTETIGTLVVFGMSVAIRRNAARSATVQERRAQLAAANAIVLTLAAIGCVVAAALLFTGTLLPMVGLVQTTVAVAAMAIFIVGIPLEALKVNYMSSMEGILDVKGLALRPLAVVAATLVAAPIVWRFGFIGAAVQSLLLTTFVVGLLGARCRQLGYSPLAVNFDRRLMLHLASFGVVSVTSGFAQSLSNTAVRASLIAAVGPTANGLLQAPWVLTQNLSTILLSSIGSIALATISPQRDPKLISAAVDRLLNVVLPVATAAMGLLGLGGSIALTILYSGSFSPAAGLFPFLLIGDVVLVFGRVVSVPILAAGDRLVWLALELLFALTRWAVAVLALDRLGVVAVVLAYSVAMIVHACASFVVVRLRHRVHVRPAQVLKVLFGAVAVGTLAWVGSQPFSPLLFGAAALFWSCHAGFYAHRMLLPELQKRFAWARRGP